MRFLMQLKKLKNRKNRKSLKSLKNLLYGAADEILRIENAAGCLRMTLPNSQESMLYHAVPHNQTTLEEFVGR